MQEFTWFSWILGVHVGAGALALLCLAIPYAARKGGLWHRRAGWIFTGAMALVGVTAWALAAARLLEADPESRASALFLAHVGLFSTASVWMGIRSVRSRRTRQLRGSPLDFAWAVALLLSSLALGAYGVVQRETLMLVFSALGIVMAVPQIGFWRKPRADASAWLVQHLGSMSNGAISAVTAFFVVNVDRLGLGEHRLLFWIAPGVIGGTGVAWLTRRVRGGRQTLATSRLRA